MISKILNAENIGNIPRIYTAVAEFLSCLIYIYFSPKRFKKGKNIFVIILFFCLFAFFHLWAGIWDVKFWILGMLIAFLLMYFFIFTISNLNKYVCGYVAVIAFVLSEFVSSIEWQINFFLRNTYSLNNNIFVYTPFKNFYNLGINLSMIIIYFLIFTILFMLEKKYWKRKIIFDVNKNDLISAFIIAVLIFTISNLSFLNIKTPISSENISEIFYIRTLVNLIGIIALYSQREHKNSIRKSIELYAMDNLLEKQQNQFKIALSAIDQVNEKYHDLKNHLSVIKNEINYDKKIAHINELENSIKPYEMIYKTQNHVLDTILMVKHHLFLENKINFTSVVDGKLLAFIKTVDLVTIFGNLIDNAIENLIKIADFEKRVLNLSVFSKSNLLFIKIENVFENKLKYDGSKLLSTKKNKVYHGFGIKSVISAVEKYDGSVKINTASNWFSIIILIPLKS